MVKLKNILIIGDSLVYGYGVPKGHEWVSILAHQIRHCNLVNKGQNGDTIENIKLRLSDELQRSNYDLVLVEGGINDFLLGRSVKAVKKDYQAILALIAKECLQAHLLFPHKPALEYDDPFYNALQFQSLVSKVDHLMDCPYPNRLLLDEIFDQDPKFFIDGIHPTIEGHKKIAKHVFEYGKRNSIW